LEAKWLRCGASPSLTDLLKTTIGIGCPGKWWSHHAWRCSKNMWMWRFRTWFSRHGGVGITAGLDDLKVFFNLNDSMITNSCVCMFDFA